MRKKMLTMLFALFVCCTYAQTTITVMDSVIYHDGYAKLVADAAPRPGVVKLRNDLFTRKLSAAELLSIGTKLQMNVFVSALCDNYDRIGNVHMALVPAGSAAYKPDTVKRIELGRFITPFMNKNVKPTTVPYTFNIDNVAMLLKDTAITDNFDIWLELSLFGVPYAANTQVAGCNGRNDVFMGKLELVTNSPAPLQSSNILLPLFFNNNFNNYQANATDSIGVTQRTLRFVVPENLTDAALFLITSNHGANTGGEEYNRRFHFVYFDDALKLSYKPGRTTCEPFRKYNTQGNGIYGSSVKSPASWQSFSNWCPGDVIDTRRIDLGPLTKGTHTFQIRVPAAVFVNKEGNFPLSLYLQGKTMGVLTNVVDNIETNDLFTVYPNPSTGQFTVELSTDNAEILVTDLLGKQKIKTKAYSSVVNLELNESGVYILHVTSKMYTSSKKIVVNR
ncbi:MAG: peptide-N-glycosidase F-related protein [Saprospiraceae bacterium]